MTSKKTKITQQESALFRQAMNDVTPLADNNKIAPVIKRRAVRKKTTDDRDIESTGSTPLFSHPGQWVAPEETLSFSRPGLDQKIAKKLKRGQYPIEARIDLHGLNGESALSAMYRFIKHRGNKRCLLIIHGKGQGCAPGSVLKSLVNTHLPKHPEVLGFHSALAHEGGTGAVYVLLKRRLIP